MALTKITSRILDSSGVTTVGTISTGVWQGTAINQTYLVGQSGTNTGDETLARINALDITELGTISSGVWNGTAIDQTYLVGQSGTNTGDQTTISGNAGTVTNGVYTVGNQTIAGVKSFSENVIIGTSGASSNRYQLRFEKWNSSHSYPSITFLTPTGSLRSGIGVNTSNDFVIGRTSSAVDTNFTNQDLKISNTTGAATFSGTVNVGSTLSVQANSSLATLELIGRTGSGFGGGLLAKSSIYSETSGAQYSANLVFKTNNGSNSLTERLRLNYNGDAIFSGDTEIITSSTPTLQLTQSGSTNYKGYIKLAGNDLEIRGSSGAMEFYNGSVDGNSSALTMSISSTGLATFQSSVQEKIKLIASSNEYSSLSFANNSGTTQWEISKNNTHDLYFYKGGYKMMLKADGKLGIGTASPDYQLDIENSSHAVLRLHAGTNSSASLRLKNDAIDWDVNCQTNDTFAIYSHTSNTQPFSILPNGNVGIGSTSPASKLTVVGGTSTFVYDNSPQGTASSVYRDAVFGSTQTVNTGITIFGTGQTGIAFGDAASHIRGQVRYQHSSDTLELGAAGNINLSISSTGAATFSNYIDTPEVRQGGEFMIGRSSNVIRMGSGDSSDSLAFYAGASQRLSITSGGDLGTRGYTASGSVSGTTYSTLNTEIIHSNGSGMKYLGKLIIRDGSRYLDIAINTTSNNIMYYFMVKGYLYNRGMYVGITSGYTYSGTIININNGTILQVGGATKSIISYRGTNSTAGNYTGHLCLRFDSGANGYSEGVLELYVGTHSSTYQNAFQIHRYAQNNTSNPWFAQ